MQVNREKSMADTAYYKALKDIEINKVCCAFKCIAWTKRIYLCLFPKGKTNTGIFGLGKIRIDCEEHENLFR